ncbi:endonuclease I [Aureococcus anophagefferens]|nr:endonuclease I [Aureococcus anophagefferens]
MLCVMRVVLAAAGEHRGLAPSLLAAGAAPPSLAENFAVVAPYSAGRLSLYGDPRSKMLAFVDWVLSDAGRAAGCPDADPSRVFLFGFSDGATEAVELLTTKRFAGGVVCSYGFTGTLPAAAVSRLADVPVWAFHSADDAIFDVANSDRLVASLRRGGVRRQDRISSPHDVVPYTSDATDTWDALYVLDADPSNADNVVGIYTRRSVAASLSGATDGWNREHLWPKSHGVGYSGADFSDLHHLVAADGSTNSARGNEIFGNCEGLPGCESPAYDEAADDTAADAESWRPPADVRGDIARAMFYMDVRYADLSLASCDFICDDPGISGNYSWLRRWHDDDPVDDAEQARSDLVCESYQLNRNPFVDYPELVARLFDDADETAARAAVCDSVCVEETDDESGASSLSAGGAMVAGVRTNPDAFAIVLLEDATGLEHLRVTDNGWSEGDGFRDSEGVLACTRAEAVAGTVLTEADFEAREGSFNLASGGDQLIVYNAAGSFVTALSINGAWDDAATSSGTSALPSELVDGETALALSAGDYDYAGSRYGAAAELREWLAAGGNWEAASGDVDATAFDFLAQADGDAGSRADGGTGDADEHDVASADACPVACGEC